MKKFLKFSSLYLAMVLIFTLPLLAQDSTATATNAAGVPASWLTYVGYAIAAWELIARLVPTAKNYTIVSKVFQFLKWVSDSLDVKKPA